MSPSSRFPSQSSCRKKERERDVPFPRPSFICLSNSLLKQAPFRVPRRNDYEESCPLLEPSLNYLSESPVNKVSWWSKISPSFLKSLVKQLLFPGPPTGHLWREREMLRFQSQWYILSFVSPWVLSKGALHEPGGKNMVTVHRAPRGRKTYIKLGETWFLKGAIYDTAVTTPVPCSLQHDTFHLGLGRPDSH
jgi:hypothetical protein